MLADDVELFGTALAETGVMFGISGLLSLLLGLPLGLLRVITTESNTNNPYGNVIAVRARDRDKPVFKTLVAAYHSDEVRQFILEQFDGAILPVF